MRRCRARKRDPIAKTLHAQASCASSEFVRGRFDALERLATTTMAERAVKRFLSAAGWESDHEKLRLAFDHVKQR